MKRHKSLIKNFKKTNTKKPVPLKRQALLDEKEL